MKTVIDIPEEIYRRAQAWITVKDKKYGDNVKCQFCKRRLSQIEERNFCEHFVPKETDNAD